MKLVFFASVRYLYVLTDIFDKLQTTKHPFQQVTCSPSVADLTQVKAVSNGHITNM
jgi:hypothetical protein